MFSVLFDLLKEKLSSEKVAVVGAVATALVAVASKYGVVVDGLALQEVLLPLFTALIARVFATSAGVKPGL